MSSTFAQNFLNLCGLRPEILLPFDFGRFVYDDFPDGKRLAGIDI